MLGVGFSKRLLLEFGQSKVTELPMEQEVLVTAQLLSLLLLLQTEEPRVVHHGLLIGLAVEVPGVCAKRVDLRGLLAVVHDLLIVEGDLVVFLLDEEGFLVHL